jgi:hypothetical protein
VQSPGEEGNELGLAHLARGHLELAVVDRAEPLPQTLPSMGTLYGGSEKTIAARLLPISVLQFSYFVGSEYAIPNRQSGIFVVHHRWSPSKTKRVTLELFGARDSPAAS